MRYFAVSPLFWEDKKVKSWTEEERNLALYVLTNQHRNLEGLFKLPYAYISEDLGWPVEDVSDRMNTLIEAGFIGYDGDAKVVFIKNALKFHSPGAPKQIQGAINALQKVPDTTLWADFVAACQTHCPKLYEEIANGS